MLDSPENKYLKYNDSFLYLENVNLKNLAIKEKTPLYVYSRAAIADNFNLYRESFAGEVGNNLLICYAVKANSNLSVLKLIASLGGGADIVSGGELFRALNAGINSD